MKKLNESPAEGDSGPKIESPSAGLSFISSFTHSSLQSLWALSSRPKRALKRFVKTISGKEKPAHFQRPSAIITYKMFYNLMRMPTEGDSIFDLNRPQTGSTGYF